jgi:protein TonB
MRNENAEDASMDDLVFENRNKEYGAYAIRKAYHDNVHKALLYVLISFAAVMALTLFFPGAPLVKVPKLSENVINFDFIAPLTVDPPKPATTTPVRRATRDVQPTVVTHTETPPMETPVDNEGPGDPNGVVDGAPPTSSGGITADASSTGTALAEVKPAGPVDIAEVMPQYQGGLQAMARYMQKNLKYPAVARRMEVEGAVFVSFIIDTNGRVIEAKVIKGISKECDEEAVRVVSSMTAWLPGRQAGIPVMVRMVLPIRFQLNR